VCGPTLHGTCSPRERGALATIPNHPRTRPPSEYSNPCANKSAPHEIAGLPLERALALEVGNVYEVAVFQAERHTCESNYRLTLSNFSRRHSECSAL
jgi:hypothetical protein